MATAFTTTGLWFGQIDGAYETAKSVEGMKPPTVGWLYRRKKFTVNRARNGQEVQSFAPLAGTTSLGSALRIDNGGDNLTANAEDIYLCEVDRLDPAPVGSAIWKQVQKWTHYEEWELWEIPSEIT
jgi:hypothetical protein